MTADHLPSKERDMPRPVWSEAMQDDIYYQGEGGGGMSTGELLEDTPSGLSDWLALNRQKTKVHEHEFKPHGDLWICWCGAEM